MQFAGQGQYAPGQQQYLVAGALYLAGSALEALSGVRGWAEAPGVTVLLVGRVLYGIAIGSAARGARAVVGRAEGREQLGLLALPRARGALLLDGQEACEGKRKRAQSHQTI